MPGKKGARKEKLHKKILFYCFTMFVNGRVGVEEVRGISERRICVGCRYGEQTCDIDIKIAADEDCFAFL